MDIFDEVRDDLKNENLVKLAKKYGKHLIFTFFAILVVVSYNVASKSLLQKKIEKAGESYFNAFDLIRNQKASEADLILSDISSSGPDGYKELALLAKARMSIEKGDSKAAIPALESLSKISKDKAIRDLADLSLIHINMENNTLDNNVAEKKFSDLTDKNDPWYYFAMELKGLWLIKNNKIDEGKKIFNLIKSDFNAPANLRNRAEKLANAY